MSEDRGDARRAPQDQPPVFAADFPSNDEPAFGRPAGVDGAFDVQRPEFPVYTPPPPMVPPEVFDTFSRPSGDERPFDPPPGARLPPRPGVARPAVSPLEQAVFTPTRPDAGAFEPAPGDRIPPRGRAPESPWWNEGAERDPWRDPGSPFSLGRPAVFVDGRPAPPEGGALPDEEIEDVEPAAPDRTVVRGRFGLTSLLLALVVALVAGAIGGGVGWYVTRRANSVLTAGGVTLGTSGQPANRPPGSVADLAKRVTPAVVSIEVRSSGQLGTGSGVIMSKVGDGAYVLTNNHVVSAAALGGAGVTIRVFYSDASSSDARIVGRDTLTDLAVLKVDRTDVTVASLGDSDKLAVGDPVLAIGSPLGLQGSVTSGIVSALHRPVRLSGEGSDTNAVIDAIQTDAAINPGNSGGALVDASGTIIGINSAIASAGGTSAGNIGVGFAIPINTARGVAQELIRTGKATHSTLGVNARSVTDGTRDGAYIVQVIPGGPAAAAGLKEGDVVTQFDEVAIGSSDELTVAVQQRPPGAQVTISYLRGAAKTTTTATLGTA